MMAEDVHCPACEEPWDRWGVTNGDMTPTEAADFFRGKGCPACHFGTRPHRRNTRPHPGILAQRLLAEETSPASGTGAPVGTTKPQLVKHTLQECEQIAQAIGWTIRHLGDNVYFYSDKTFGAHAREDEYEGFNELYDALGRIQRTRNAVLEDE